MRITLPRAHTAARCIDEDAVEFRLGWRLGRTIPWCDAIIENLGAGGTAFERIETAGMAIAGPNGAFAGHQVGEVQGLAALAGAGVPPRLAGFGRTGVADEL